MHVTRCVPNYYLIKDEGFRIDVELRVKVERKITNKTYDFDRRIQGHFPLERVLFP